MMRQNILVLSAGRRVSLVRAFRKEAAALLPGAQVYAADLKPQLSAACQVADAAFAVPRVTSEAYVPALLALCRSHQIGLVIPTIDTELLVLAQHRAAFLAEGTHLVVSALELVRECRNKRLTADLFDRIGLPNPQIFTLDTLQFPCFAKPVDGSCSQNIHTLRSAEELSPALRADPGMMFMELIDKTIYQEFTIDLYYDRQHQLRCLVPRRRIEVRGGEVSKGITDKGQLYQFLLQRLTVLPGAVGCITLQVFSHPQQESVYGIEVNPRFGGGYPLSYCAGANYPGWLIREYLRGESLAFQDDWEDKLLLLRYDDEVLVHGFTAD